MCGIFVSFPFGLGSAFVEWREQYLGFSKISHPLDHEIFIGRLQITYSAARPRRVPVQVAR